MLGFGKKKKDKPASPRDERGEKPKKGKIDQEAIDPKLAEQIHTMPERFYIKPPKKRSSLVLIIGIGIFVIIILGGVAFYFVYTLNQPTVEPPDQQTMVDDIPEEDDILINDSEVSATTDLEIVDIIDEEEEELIDETAAIEAQELSIDIDGDNLTLVEELLFKTDVQAVDTDGDGFEDGTEVLNGYDPNVADKTLLETGIFRQYTNEIYSITYPSIWEFREQNLDNTEVLFISDSGEFVEVLILPNINQLSLQDWYTQQFPEFAQIIPIKVKINNVGGILHPDGRNYYLVASNDLTNIYIITYNIGNFIELKYQTIFRSMANSFKVVESL